MVNRLVALSVLGISALAMAWAMVSIGAGTGESLAPADRVAVDRFLAARATLHRARDARIGDETRRELAMVDPLNTGIVGIEWSPLVSTQGILDAKQLSAHPVWVVQFRRWFAEVGLKPGDIVGIGSSGSFPGLLLAARVAAESMGLRVRAVGSLAASNHGATIPEFDLWEMEKVLVREANFSPAMVAITPGGDDDRALGFEGADRALLMARLDAISKETGAPRVALPESRAESLRLREELLLDGGEPVALYINIGGHVTNFGTGREALATPRGLILPGDIAAPEKPASLVAASLARDVPVLNVLDLRGLLTQNGWQLNSLSDRIPSAVSLSAPRRTIALIVGIALPCIALLCRAPRGPRHVNPQRDNLPCAF